MTSAQRLFPGAGRDRAGALHGPRQQGRCTAAMCSTRRPTSNGVTTGRAGDLGTRRFSARRDRSMSVRKFCQSVLVGTPPLVRVPRPQGAVRRSQMPHGGRGRRNEGTSWSASARARPVGVDRGCGHRPGTKSGAGGSVSTDRTPDDRRRRRRVRADVIASGHRAVLDAPRDTRHDIDGRPYDDGTPVPQSSAPPTSAASTTTTVPATSTTVAGTSTATSTTAPAALPTRVARPRRATRRTWHGHDRRPRHRPVWGRHPRCVRPVLQQRRFVLRVHGRRRHVQRRCRSGRLLGPLLAIRQRSHT